MKTLEKKLGRVIIPMLTPIKENGDVDYDQAARLANYLVERDYCTALLVAGTTGEFYTLEHEERIELMSVVADAVGGKMPLLAGTGASSAREAIKFTVAAEKMGYDCAMVVSPYYCKPAQEGIYQYFRSVSESVSIPIMLYNIPIFTGINVEPDTVTRLSKLPNIMGIKDEAGINPVQMTDFMLCTDDDFTVYNGDDIMILCGMAQGAAGVVSGFSHLAGDKVRAMIDQFMAGRLEEARKIHYVIHPILRALCPNGRVNPGPLLRAAMELRGVHVGKARLPLDSATEQEISNLRMLMEKADLL